MIRALMALAYLSAFFGYALICAIFIAQDPWRGAVWLWCSGLVVVAIFYINTGKFWPSAESPQKGRES